MRPGEIALSFAGILLMLQGLLPLRKGRLNAGLAFCAALGMLLLLCGLLSGAIRALVPAWVRGLFLLLGCALGAVLLCVFAFLRVRGGRGSLRGDEDALIVLGAAVHRGRINATLKSRLDGALAAARANESLLVVLSGGKGQGERISEAEAMAGYLLARGVRKERLLLECRSTNTRENFLFSKALLAAEAPQVRIVAFLTSRFHVYRAAHKARLAGLSLRGLGVRTPVRAVLPNYLRESFAVLRLWLLGY